MLRLEECLLTEPPGNSIHLTPVLSVISILNGGGVMAGVMAGVIRPLDLSYRSPALRVTPLSISNASTAVDDQHQLILFII